MDLFFSLNGRIGRGKWWLGTIIITAIYALALIMAAQSADTDTRSTTGIVFIVVYLAIIWPTICITGKRFHDRDKSAWWVLISLIPLIGALWILIECGFLVGTRGENRFGPDPIER